MVSSAHTRASLASDLGELGIRSGDLVFVHSSFKSLGNVEGGAESVVGACEDAIGEDGLLLMPSFNLVGGRDERADRWDVDTTPSSVGWLTEFFRQMAGTVRSDHYSHSTAVRGRGAESLVADHRSQRGMASPWDRLPWGRTYGEGSPMIKAYERDGKILMIGVDHTTSTYCHVVEVRFWAERKQADIDAPFIWLDRDRLGEYWDKHGEQAIGRLGDAETRVMGIRTYVDGLLEAVRCAPDRYDRVKLGTR